MAVVKVIKCKICESRVEIKDNIRHGYVGVCNKCGFLYKPNEVINEEDISEK